MSIWVLRSFPGKCWNRARSRLWSRETGPAQRGPVLSLPLLQGRWGGWLNCCVSCCLHVIKIFRATSLSLIHGQCRSITQIGIREDGDHASGFEQRPADTARSAADPVSHEVPAAVAVRPTMASTATAVTQSTE